MRRFCGINKRYGGPFSGIDLGNISVSQTINGPAIILLAFYIATAEKQGVSKKESSRNIAKRHS